MAASAISTFEPFRGPHALDQSPPVHLSATEAHQYELLILAFAHCAHAELVARRLSRTSPSAWSPVTDALVLTRDTCGASAVSIEGDFIGHLGRLPAGTRSIVLQLLPGPLSVLTGQGISPRASDLNPAESLLSSADCVRLAPHLAVNSSVALFLVEQPAMAEFVQRLAQVELAAQAERLQVSLDENIERFAMRLERLRTVAS
jgi:hypothetical protein